MKPEKLIFDEPDKTEIVAEVPVKTQKLIHSIKPYKGHTLFAINPITGKCSEAEYESITANISGAVRKKVIAEANCVYISALNKRNALIKFFKMVGKQISNSK